MISLSWADSFLSISPIQFLMLVSTSLETTWPGLTARLMKSLTGQDAALAGRRVVVDLHRAGGVIQPLGRCRTRSWSSSRRHLGFFGGHRGVLVIRVNVGVVGECPEPEREVRREWHSGRNDYRHSPRTSLLRGVAGCLASASRIACFFSVLPSTSPSSLLQRVVAFHLAEQLGQLLAHLQQFVEHRHLLGDAGRARSPPCA